jgi:hypothetical protein
MEEKKKRINFKALYSKGVEAEGEKYCATDKCEIF